MAYVEAHAGLKDHLKTKKVARFLQIPKPQAIGHLLCLWWWCQEYAQDGDLSDFDEYDIAEAAEWEGDPQTFVDALLNCGARGGAGFLKIDEDTGAMVVNDWYQYGGKLFVKRQQSAERMRRYRERNANETDSNEPEMQTENDVTRNECVTNAQVTHIDKIRGDQILVTQGAIAPSVSSSSLVEQFDTMLADMNQTKDKVPHLMNIYRLCFGELNMPKGGEFAGAAKQVGSAQLLAKYMFDNVTNPPVGPVLPYIIATHKAKQTRRNQTGGNRAPENVTFNNGSDIYA